MTWTPIIAFMVLLFFMSLGDIVSVGTKGKVPGLVVTMAFFLILGAGLSILPSDMVDTSGLGNILSTYGMLLVFVNIGASLNFKQFINEWKTVVVAIIAVLAVTLMGVTIGQAIFGKVYGLSCIATIAGGLPAVLITQQAAEAANRPDISAFVMTILCVQQILAIPIASWCLNREAAKFVKTDIFLKGSVEEEKSRFNIRFIKELPQKYQTTYIILFRLSFIAVIASLISEWTGINSTVCALILGFFATEIGFIDKGGLEKAGANGLILLGCIANTMKNFLTLPLSDFLAMLVPIVGLLLLGAIAGGVFSALAGKLLKWSPYLAVATGMTMMIGYPATYVMAMDCVKTFTSSGEYTEGQVKTLENYLVPKMVIGGVVSVSIVSVIIASIIAPNIF